MSSTLAVQSDSTASSTSTFPHIHTITRTSTVQLLEGVVTGSHGSGQIQVLTITRTSAGSSNTYDSSLQPSNTLQLLTPPHDSAVPLIHIATALPQAESHLDPITIHLQATGLKQAVPTSSSTQRTLPNEPNNPGSVLPLALSGFAVVVFFIAIIILAAACYRRHREAEAPPPKPRNTTESQTPDQDEAVSISSEVWPDIDELAEKSAGKKKLELDDSESEYEKEDEKEYEKNYEMEYPEDDYAPNPARKSMLVRFGAPHRSSSVTRKLDALEEYHLPSLKDLHQSRLSMRLRALDSDHWLTMDPNYLIFHEARSQLLHDYREQVMQYQDVPRVQLACEEVRDLVVEFLTAQYPQFFRQDEKYIYNEITSEQFDLGPYSKTHPLEIATRLAMEDFNVLMMDDGDEDHRLVASATLFPAGWRLQDRFNWTVTQLHNPVPKWSNNLSRPVEKYISRLSETNSMERYAYFIQIDQRHCDLATLLFVPEPADFYPAAVMHQLTPADVIVRRERQSFRRLLQSGAVLFTVHTSIHWLVEMSDDELAGLAEQIRGWDADQADYRQREAWGECVLRYCDERVGMQ